MDQPVFCETACYATVKCTGIKNINLKPYSSHLPVQPSTTAHTASSIGARAPTEWRAFPAGVSRPEKSLPKPSEWKLRPWTLPHGTLPLAEEVSFPILSPPTSHRSSERGFPCYTLTKKHICVWKNSVWYFTTESNNNNKRCSGIISTTFSVSKAIINGFLFYSPKRKKGLRSSHWLLLSASPSQLSLPLWLGTCTMEKVRGGDIR